MRMLLKSLRFNLPDKPFGSNTDKLFSLVTDLEKITKIAGTDNDKFKLAWGRLLKAIQNNTSLDEVLNDKIDIRVLGFALSSEDKDEIRINKNILTRISNLVDKPNSLFIQDLFQYYLNNFSKIDDIEFVSQWLITARKTRHMEQSYDENLLSANGDKWLAELAITKQIGFDQVIHDLELDQFQSGQFMESAQRIYYVEQLKNIPINQPHDLLTEVQKPDVFKAKFDEAELLGHQVLKILISRAPTHDIDDSWRNTVMAIAGDPRIPVGHPRYINWWSHVSKDLISKVEGWLSGLELKLFLEALDDFSYSSYDQDMKRMFPSRKKFLEGLYDKKLIKKTKLYMSRRMADFLNGKYKKEHLPDFSIVKDGEKSIIYVDLENAHMVEGSHQCQLWIYRSLHESAPVLQNGIQYKSYRSLTIGLHESMERQGQGAYDYFTHSPTNFSWQKRAVKSLKDLRVSVTMKDVLTPNEYSVFVRRFGAS
ncbi:MAG: hypothetical protein ACJAS1_004814 [Oleiphilaceae bacterium]|jgi:hypothetical protein